MATIGAAPSVQSIETPLDHEQAVPMRAAAAHRNGAAIRARPRWPSRSAINRVSLSLKSSTGAQPTASPPAWAAKPSARTSPRPADLLCQQTHPRTWTDSLRWGGAPPLGGTIDGQPSEPVVRARLQKKPPHGGGSVASNPADHGQAQTEPGRIRVSIQPRPGRGFTSSS